jgi:hypothetical protein
MLRPEMIPGGYYLCPDCLWLRGVQDPCGCGVRAGEQPLPEPAALPAEPFGEGVWTC